VGRLWHTSYLALCEIPGARRSALAEGSLDIRSVPQAAAYITSRSALAEGGLGVCCALQAAGSDACVSSCRGRPWRCAASRRLPPYDQPLDFCRGRLWRCAVQAAVSTTSRSALAEGGLGCAQRLGGLGLGGVGARGLLLERRVQPGAGARVAARQQLEARLRHAAQRLAVQLRRQHRACGGNRARMSFLSTQTQGVLLK